MHKVLGWVGGLSNLFFFSKKIKSKGEWYDKKRKKEREWEWVKEKGWSVER